MRAVGRTRVRGANLIPELKQSLDHVRLSHELDAAAVVLGGGWVGAGGYQVDGVE